MSGSRVRYSINLDEDFELYGIDPNEDLDDWSFLDAKPEPIPEKSEEEKRLFEQLLQPTINEDDINRDIHARLKNLISETDQIIENNENDPLLKDKREEIKKNAARASLNTPDIKKEQENTPGMQQANRVKNIMKSIMESASKAEDISIFIEECTKSDRIDPNTIEVPESSLSKPVSRLLPAIKKSEEKEKKKAEKKDSEVEKEVSKEPEDKKKEEITKNNTKEKEEVKEEETPIKEEKEENSFLDKLDETEQLQKKFEEERRKREEEAEREAERKQKEIEERSRKFIEMLQKEQERREKMPARIAEFTKQLNDQKTEITVVQKPAFVVELLSERQKPVKTKCHESKTFLSNINTAVAEKLRSTFEAKKKKRVAKAAIKVALFLKFAYEKSLAKKGNAFIMKNAIETWTKKLKAKLAAKKQEEKDRDILRKAKRTFAAIRLQRQIRAYLVRAAEEEEKERKRLENERKNREALEAQKRKFEELQRKKKESMQSLNIMLPDNDDSWINSFKNEDTDSDFEEFLKSLDTKPQIKEEPSQLSKFELQSGTVPVDDAADPLNASSKSSSRKEETEDDEIARVRAEIEARVRKARINAKHNGKEATRTSVSSTGTVRSSVSSTGTANSSATNKTPQHGSKATGGQQEQQGEGYKFSEETLNLMRMAQNRHKKNYKNEAPLDRYNRIYGGNPRSGNDDVRRSKPKPVAAASIMRYHNTKTKRLQKLQKAWFEGNRQENGEN